MLKPSIPLLGRALAIAATVALAAQVSATAAAAPANPASRSSATNATGIDVQLPRLPITIVGTLTTQPGGAPFARATVLAIDSLGHKAGYGLADNGGRYRIAGLPHGDYRIAVGPGEAGDPAFQSGFYRSGAIGQFTPSLSAATVLHYAGTKLTGRDIQVPSGSTLSGRVTAAAGGAGVANVYITLHSTAPGAQLFSDIFAATDATGHYVASGLSPRSYTVAVQALLAADNVQSGCYRASAAHHFTADCSSASAIAITGSNVSGIDVALPRGVQVSGIVVDRTSAENPLCAAITVVRAVTHHTVWSIEACGAFTVDHLAPGDYQVLVLPSFGAAFMPGAYKSGNPSQWIRQGGQPTTIHLTGDTNLGIIRPLLGHSVSGRILDTSGSPLANASVLIRGTQGWCCQTAYTAADGTFALRGLGDRHYVIAVSATFGNYQSGWYDAALTRGFTPDRANATEFTLPADRAGVNVRIPAGFTISGVITDNNGHGAQVAVRASGQGAPTYSYDTGPDGTYTLQGFVPGRYRVHVDPGIGAGIPLTAGWYSATAPGHFTIQKRNATLVRVGH